MCQGGKLGEEEGKQNMREWEDLVDKGIERESKGRDFLIKGTIRKLWRKQCLGKFPENY